MCKVATAQKLNIVILVCYHSLLIGLSIFNFSPIQSANFLTANNLKTVCRLKSLQYSPLPIMWLQSFLLAHSHIIPQRDSEKAGCFISPSTCTYYLVFAWNQFFPLISSKSYSYIKLWIRYELFHEIFIDYPSKKSVSPSWLPAGTCNTL